MFYDAQGDGGDGDIEDKEETTRRRKTSKTTMMTMMMLTTTTKTTTSTRDPPQTAASRGRFPSTGARLSLQRKVRSQRRQLSATPGLTLLVHDLGLFIYACAAQRIPRPRRRTTT